MCSKRQRFCAGMERDGTFSAEQQSRLAGMEGERFRSQREVRADAAAALPASELAALPVDEQAMIFAPASAALATAMALARSFKEAVGFWPSSLTQSFFSPS